MIEVVYAQFSFGSLGLFKGSWLHFCKGANLTPFKYPLNPLVLLVTLLLNFNQDCAGLSGVSHLNKRQFLDTIYYFKKLKK